MSPPPTTRFLKTAGVTREVTIERGPAPREAAGPQMGRVQLDGDANEVPLPTGGAGSYPLDWHGRRYRVAVARVGRTIEVSVDGRRLVVEAVAGSAAAAGADGEIDGELRAPMPGKVVEIARAVGDAVRAGDPVLALEAMKLRNALNAPFDGVVEAIDCAVGDQVTGGQRLASVRPAAADEEGSE